MLILCHDRSDYEDVENKTKDSIRRANCLLVNFVVCSSSVKSCLLQFFCTFFYGAALWRLACHVTLQVQANVFLLQGKHFIKEIHKHRSSLYCHLLWDNHRSILLMLKSTPDFINEVLTFEELCCYAN